MNRSEPAQALCSGRPQVARAPSSRLSWLHTCVEHLGAKWAARRKRAREFRDLYLFNARELRDVGLSRSDFPAIAKGAYRRD
ncbi:MAG: DUF1127 domain-containing protein [Acetobacteraceae bacterium]|jgi:uncharacterized protein YjiS (DUF1127 family)